MPQFFIRPAATAYEPISSTILGPVFGAPVRLIEGTRKQVEAVVATMGHAPLPDGFLSHHEPLQIRWDVCRASDAMFERMKNNAKLRGKIPTLELVEDKEQQCQPK